MNLLLTSDHADSVKYNSRTNIAVSVVVVVHLSACFGVADLVITKMTNPKGYRRGTRHMFERKFRKHGNIPLSTYMKVYKKGDRVDIKVHCGCLASLLLFCC